MKKFLISIDTEGDNLWAWKPGDPVTTENAAYLARFQQLCARYGFKPTYLTNYEMASSPTFCSFAAPLVRRGACEIGMHLHAWNTPPDFALQNCREQPGAPYLVEYPDAVMEAKIRTMTDLLTDTFEVPICTHRAGRWAMDDRYFRLLEQNGYTVDCSVTPHLNWRHSAGATAGSSGCDYTAFPEQPYRVAGCNTMLEIPVTVRAVRHYFAPEPHTARAVCASLYRAVRGRRVWLRPSGRNLRALLWLTDRVEAEPETDYIMFMLHSSELMPGGSPTFRTTEDIERLYAHMEALFAHAAQSFAGATIGEYGRMLAALPVGGMKG